ncbi:MAG: agmatine deiminase [Ignavibacteria bacterium RIFOXYB2_FULL_35_12]|nr:MAG: agmatine deiminase [Ignavibacteria bacterium GWA2_36_19]OGU62308.1 MAG: agmatine deiminase [Ignavibacteria bacterium GWF2_35_20]OGU86181.1 MAG: agmatine deiminase [Ignavibacteria bacterium RIFOXYA12_FULL_35_25]OGU90871.1 MAG: agmatine deiminase [Ignavibacteria bacterium RIFOXYC12_FULL_35_11]OGU92957.1 MAG: agmatine deiminase [Ignavibacteria bacterium RIFOXYB12_FULL_35_14]OGU99283.1 MAG: agmatine deiminase [Ignavibacteria bacterium RIFOXYC2_FULL_35_16]OGV04018.1 MAG: agmatine deiminase
MRNKKPNYRLPAEWENHEATWIGWPHNREDWPGKFTPIIWVYCEIVKKIAEGEKVRIIVESSEHKKKAIRALKDSNTDLTNVEFFILKTNRGWTRDSGPIFVKSKTSSELNLVSFKFNAWAKYNNYKKDAHLPGFISKKMNLKSIKPIHKNFHVVLEAGSIDSNGDGVLLTTEECLLDPKVQVRNKDFSKSDYEKVFHDYLGIQKVIWLGKGIVGDDTHGHVDDLCRFVSKDKVALVQEENSKDDNYKILKENKERLESVILPDASKLEVIDLPMPSPVVFKGQRLPASYANFYISNSYILVPTFNDVKDKAAIGILSEIFSDRKVVGIHAVDLVWGLGTLHCLTHEQPLMD